MKLLATFALVVHALLSVSCAAQYAGAPGFDMQDALASSEQGGWAQAEAAPGLARGASVALASLESPTAPEPGARGEGAERQVIYSASLSIVVVSIAEAQASALSFAREVGGHLQQSDGASITVRVPAAKFDDVLARIARLGEVVDRQVTASDVTEELVDLDIRLDNARRARERLLEHLANSERIEDTLKIEAELTRVTGELERMEGRRRFLAAQVALSTIRAQFNSTAPQGAQRGPVVPFDWIERLGDGLIAGALEGRPRKPRLLASGPSFDAPASFLRYYQSRDLVEAMDADGLRIKVQRQDNHDKGQLEFWQKLARRALVESRALSIDSERALSKDRALLSGTREVAGEVNGYMLVLLRTEKRLYTFEAWGPRARFEASRAALEASAASLRP